MFAMLVVAALQIAAPPSDARQLALTAPQVVTDVDVRKLKGELTRLAWSPDGSDFYLQVVERDSHGAVRSTKHYMLSAKGMKGIDQEPAWASKYWSWKSDRSSPSSPAFSIVASNRQETVRSTSAPAGGIMAKGGVADPTAGTTVAEVASAAEQTQIKSVWSLKVKNETIGEWANEPVIPGMNFSWAPAPIQMIAFARRDGGPLIVVDDAGHKQQLTGAKAAVLPAWSDDGKRIAWLERKDKTTFALTIAEITAQ